MTAAVQVAFIAFMASVTIWVIIGIARDLGLLKRRP